MKTNKILIVIVIELALFSMSFCHTADRWTRQLNETDSIETTQLDYLENCTVADDCQWFEKCAGNSCIAACESISCGDNAHCIVRNHKAICSCSSRHVYEPDVGCVRQNCSTSSDCYAVEKCDGHDCINACELSPCGENAWCIAHAHVAICTCPPELSGDPFIKCEERNCTAHTNCTELQRCVNTTCIDACESFTCGEYAWCDVRDHSPICDCIHRYIGDPVVGCVEQNCTTNSDCDELDVCEDKKCIDPCESVSCGDNAWCDVNNHIPSCTCMDKYSGDPHTNCGRAKCSSHSDCFESEKCEENDCLDACDSIICGHNAQCEVKNHNATCTCPMGLTGDPLTKCAQTDCTVDEDCDEFLECRRKKCILKVDIDLYELIKQHI